MNNPNSRVLELLHNSISFEKPYIRFSRGFVVCDWCDRQIKANHLYFVQRQVLNKDREHFAKLCFTCGKEKRGAMYFEGFTCRKISS